MGISTFFGIELGKRGLQSHRIALDTTGHNITNASTPGYSRQRAEIVTELPFTTPTLERLNIAGQLGTGSTVSEIARSHSYFLDTQINNETSTAQRWDARYDNLKQVELLFNEPSDDAVRSVLDEFWKAFEDLSNDPETPATRKVVIERGIALSESISHLYSEFNTIRQNLNELLISEVDDVNRLCSEIAKLNQTSLTIENMGDNPNDILDRRDYLLGQLAEKLNIDVHYQGGQELIVSVSGQTIIQGGSYNPLSTYTDLENESLETIDWGVNNISLSSDEDVFTAFATSSVKNQSVAIDVQNLAKKNMQVSQVPFAYEEQPVGSVENHTSITSGFVSINGKQMYIDAENDTLVDIIDHINNLDAGVFASLSDDGENRLVLTATRTGVDNAVHITSAKQDYELPTDETQKWVSEGSSNFFRIINMETYFEGDQGVIDPDENLFSITNSNGDFFLTTMPAGQNEVFYINGYSIVMDTSSKYLGQQISLREMRDEINRHSEDTNVAASLIKDDNGRYRLLLEGLMNESSQNEFNVRDDFGILNRFGIQVPQAAVYVPAGPSVNSDEILQYAGHCVSGKYADVVDGLDEKGLLEGGNNSTFRITDADGDFIDLTIIPDDNDSLTEIKNLINKEVANSGNVDIEAELLKTPEGQVRLWIHSTDGRDWTLSRPNGVTNGRILDILKMKPGTYNEQGPVNINAYNAKYTFNGISTENQYNVLTEEVDGATIHLRGEGLAKFEVRQWLTNGKLKGILEARDEIIPYYMKKMDDLAYTVMHNINQQHFEGFGLDGKSQRNFFEVFYSSSEYDNTYRAALSMDIDAVLKDNVNYIAAAGRDPVNTDLNGLPVSNGSGDGSNAIEIAKIKELKLMNNGLATYDEYFNELISKAGVEAQEADRIYNNQELLLTKLENERQSVQGVSLDEELANMIKYQQGYNACAKIVTTMDKILDTIIGLKS